MALSADQGIQVRIIGDSGPFSRLGKSIGYMFTYKDSEFLLDCGAPLFQHFGADGLQRMKGMFCTHSHDDHKRWFTDIALWLRYTPGINRRLTLYTTEAIHEEFEKNSRAALERTLTNDQKKVVEMPYEVFVNPVPVGPRAKFRIASVPLDGKDHFNGAVWRVVDRRGQVVPPEKAKIVVQHHRQANRPRMLFFDERYQEWVEPISFYHFGDAYFYEEDSRPYVDAGTGLKVTPQNAHSWHGPPTTGYLVESEHERFLFSSDTVYDADLWEALASEKRKPVSDLKDPAFLKAPIIAGEINDYIERAWSFERLEAAKKLYASSIILHDCCCRHGVVHTDFERIRNAPFLSHTILTHTPDKFTSHIALASEGRLFRVIRDSYYEQVGNRLRSFDADFYVKDMRNKYALYRDEQGDFKVVDDGHVLHFMPWGEETPHKLTARVQAYADIDGEYYPYLSASETKRYRHRGDGRVELVTYDEQGSRGQLMRDLRDDIEAKYKRGLPNS